MNDFAVPIRDVAFTGKPNTTDLDEASPKLLAGNFCSNIKIFMVYHMYQSNYDMGCFRHKKPI